MKDIEITQVRPNSHIIRFSKVKAGWEQWVLLSSDRHHDSAQCRRDLELSHLQEAVKRGAIIIDAGDVFDAMQGKGDKRSAKAELRVENLRNNYFDSLVTSAAEFYKPFAKNFMLIGRGNHESSVIDHHGVDLISNLVYRLNAETGSKIYAGGYGGWVIFQFTIQKTRIESRALKYFHGSGGGGAVTKGVIQSNRMAVIYPDADIVLSGHTHDSWLMPIKRDRVSTRTGSPFQDVAFHVRTPTYKDDYGEGHEGWRVERGGEPKPLGAIWIRFYVDGSDDGAGRTNQARRVIAFDITPAVS